MELPTTLINLTFQVPLNLPTNPLHPKPFHTQSPTLPAEMRLDSLSVTPKNDGIPHFQS